MQDITTQLVRMLAAANGIQIPEERLEVVRAQYETFLRSLAEINSVTLARETEPATVFSLMPPAPARPEGDK
ncbi:MAG: hypothetical protein ABIS06_07425 [Vicinamibacterales bacterium]